MKIEAVDIQNISGNQAIQLPNELRINDDKVYLKKIGSIIYIKQKPVSVLEKFNTIPPGQIALSVIYTS